MSSEGRRRHKIRKEYEKHNKAKDKEFNQALAAWKREVIELKKDHRKQRDKLGQLHRKALKNMAKYLQKNKHYLSRNNSEAFTVGNQRNKNEDYAELNRRLTDLEDIVQEHTNELALQYILSDNTHDSEIELVKDEFPKENLSARTRPYANMFRDEFR